MGELEDLKKQLRGLQSEKQKAQDIAGQKSEINRLKKQIKAEKFGRTTGGKIFNKIADVGDAGLKATGKFLAPRPLPPAQKGKKKKTPVRLSVEEVMARLPQ